MKLSLACFCLFFLMSWTSYSQTADGPVVKPAATSAESPEIREFQKIEDSWATAVNDRDQYGLELVLSPLFVDVSASGDITTRNQQVASVLTGEDKTIHLEQRVITVRMLGDIAVANGTYSLRTVLREDTNTKPKKKSEAEMPFHIPLLSK